ncbi:hypothetical protein OG585_47070 (plasmid) [Streptomyces sp. NBC_01340]|jgi:hypothetical protein|uniref:hypothetical protein n=1 Tax=Streptomyces sp. NBC_01340 TaxID=2903830 RepID=UPI002E0DBC2B|nr:hypothetical protein OG585_47070 [Streptomyces sp. NBC_01340]
MEQEMKPADWITLAAIFLALLTLITSSASAARARVKTIEDAYIARYRQILDRFPTEALVGIQGSALLAEDSQKAVRLYLRLCEDELELRQLGWVGRNTWQQWRPGIETQLKQWPVAEEWNPIRDGQRAPHQFELLRRLATTPHYDPYQPTRLGRIARIWRQL